MRLKRNIVKNIYVIYVCLLMCMLYGCLNRAKSEFQTVKNNEAEIRIGMSYDEVKEIKKCEFDTVALVSPSNIDEACKIIENGFEFVLAFDEEEKKVTKIEVFDKRYRLLNGLGVGSTFGAVKERYDDYEIYSLPGYSTQVKIEGEVTFAFGLIARDINDTDIINWLELQQITVKRKK